MTGPRTWLGNEGIRTVACHREGELSIIRETILDFKPELMVELGTCVGGITLLLHECFPTVPLHTFDNKSMIRSLKKAKSSIEVDYIEAFQREAFNDNVKFYITNIFIEGKEVIEDILTSDKRKFLYSDNGKKKDEINLFAKCLLVGDLLGVHDWGYEIGWEWEGIKETLASFEEHFINKRLEKENLTSRFFRKIK